MYKFMSDVCVSIDSIDVSYIYFFCKNKFYNNVEADVGKK